MMAAPDDGRNAGDGRTSRRLRRRCRRKMKDLKFPDEIQ
jgi:hypothetical protein